MLKEKLKYTVIKKTLIDDIRNKKLLSGQRLEGERQLAERFGVSSKTAKRAINELVEDEILETRLRSGTYVRDGVHKKIKTRTLNIICTAYENGIARAFLNNCNLAAEQRGWQPHVVRIHPELTRPAIQAIRSGEYCIALLDGPDLQGPIGKAIIDNSQNAVLVGNDLSAIGVTSVLCDDALGMRMAMDTLCNMGHRKVGLVVENAEHQVTMNQIAAWKNYYGHESSDFDDRLIILGNKAFECPMTYGYEATCKALEKSTDLTGLISLNPEATVGVVAACRDMGLDVPSKISIVNMGDTPTMKFITPSVSCVDPDIPAHIHAAVECLEKLADGGVPQHDRKILIQPKLIERRSISAVTSM